MFKRLLLIGFAVITGFVFAYGQTEASDSLLALDGLSSKEFKQQQKELKKQQKAARVLGIHPWKRTGEVNQALSHWSLNFEGGIDMFDGDFTGIERTVWPNAFYRPTGAVSLEYDFNPIWGAMLQYTYADYGAHSETGEAILVGGYMHTAEFLFSFDLVDAWFPKRKSTIFSAYVLAGGGLGLYNSSFYPAQYLTEEQPLRRPSADGRDDITALVSLGMMLEWNLSRVMAFNVKGMVHLYSKDNLETKVMGQTNDRMEYVTAGLRFKLGGYKKSHVRNFSSDRNDLEDVFTPEKNNQKDTLVRIDTIVISHCDTLYISDTLFCVGADGSVHATPIMKALVQDVLETIVVPDTQVVHRTVSEARRVDTTVAKNATGATDTTEAKNATTAKNATEATETKNAKNITVTENVTNATEFIEARRYVYFQNGGAKLTEGALCSVQQVAQILEDYPNCCLELTGVCDFTGSTRLNDALGLKRAERVAKELHDVYKIPYSRMITLTRGKIDNVKHAYAPNRRCEIRFVSWQQLQELKEAYKIKNENVTVEEEVKMEDEVEVKKEVKKEPAAVVKNEAPIERTSRGVLATVTTAKNMTLANLARKYYKNVHCWPYIYLANKHVMSSPNILLPGKKLTIPKLTDTELQTTESQVKELLK